MLKIKLNNKGVSLGLTIGLFLLLIIIATTVNELVIRALRASHQIEASDKAYFAAEAGIEDALYELSAHDAGYETGDLDGAESRETDFTQTVAWKNEWDIKSTDLNDCASLDEWEGGFNPNYCGRITGKERLSLPLFDDTALGNGIPINEINPTPEAITRLNFSHLEIKFRLPKTLVTQNSLTDLEIDNDQDYNPETGVGLNEDGHVDFGFGTNPCAYSDGLSINDNDCDLKEDEDSREDPVILWKLLDDQGHTFQPLRGCKGDPSHPSHNETNANLCEKNFIDQGNGEISVSLNELDKGYDENGNIVNLDTFLLNLPNDSKVKLEFLVVAPMEHIDANEQKRIAIPYYEYGIEYDAGGESLPSTFFTLRSDGYYRDFKQSITTNVAPGSDSKLLDLTIIQQ